MRGAIEAIPEAPVAIGTIERRFHHRAIMTRTFRAIKTAGTHTYDSHAGETIVNQIRLTVQGRGESAREREGKTSRVYLLVSVYHSLVVYQPNQAA